MFFGKEHQHNITNTKRGGRDESRPIHVLDMADQLSCWMDASQCESFIFYHHDSGCQESMIPMALLVAEPTALRRSRLKTYEANTANQKNTKAEQTNNNNHEAPKEAFNPNECFLDWKDFFLGSLLRLSLDRGSQESVGNNKPNGTADCSTGSGITARNPNQTTFF